MGTSLWGEQPISESKEKAPVAILRDQAAEVARFSSGRLVGVVDTADTEGGLFEYDLKIRAPSLNNYTFLVLTVKHRLDYYPLQITSDTMKWAECNDESEFVKSVETILQSTRVRRALAALRAQMK